MNVSWDGRSGDPSATVNSLCFLSRSLDLAGFRFLVWITEGGTFMNECS